MASAIRTRSLLGLASLFGLLGVVVGENKIIYPASGSMTFYAGDIVTVKYITDYSGPKLNIFCYKDTGDGSIVNPLVQTITTGEGSKTVTLDIGTGVNGCWFNIQNNNDIWGVNSPFWDYKQSRPVQQTSSVPTTNLVVVSETPAAPSPTGGSGNGGNAGGAQNTDVPSMTSSNPQNSPAPGATLTIETAGGSVGSSPSTESGSSGNNGGVAPSPQPTSGSSTGTSSSSGSSNGNVDNGAVSSAGGSPEASATPAVVTINGSVTTILAPVTGPSGVSSGGSNGNGNSNGNAGTNGNNGSNGSAGTNGSSGSTGKDGESSDAGLSTGAKAGIGAAVAICAALAIAGLVFFILAKRKQKRGGSLVSELPVEDNQYPYGVEGKTGSQGQGSGGWSSQPSYQNGGAGPYEMDIGQRMPELDTTERPQDVAPGPAAYQRNDKW